MSGPGVRPGLGLGLRKTRSRLRDKLSALLGRSGSISPEVWDEWEEALVGVDLGVETALELVEETRQRAREEKIREPGKILEVMEDILARSLAPSPAAAPATSSSPSPETWVLVGVNGSGKTTTLAKLAWFWSRKGEKVLVAAADTFRAAAGEQLRIWTDRAGVELVSQQPGADPAAVAFDAVSAARARGFDRVLVDTAGRLHNRRDLMGEAAKIIRVLEKALGAPPRVLLVLDATVGQNGLIQAESFSQAIPVAGLVLTKLDGTARGGIVVPISRRLGLPVLFLGVGERLEDLVEFDPGEFARALLSPD